MLYWEIIAVCSEIHTKHINALCGQNVELLNVKLMVHIVTSGIQMAYCVYVCLCLLGVRRFMHETDECAAEHTEC